MYTHSAGRSFTNAIYKRRPLQILGATNPSVALLAQQSGAQALYLSGAGVANFSYGLPDLGMTNLSDVVQQLQQIKRCVDIPILVDADTGFGGQLNARETTCQLIRAGAAAMHIEDQDWPKRCGHRDGKKLISIDEMCKKIAIADEAKIDLDPHFTVMARTDAIAVEGIDAAIERLQAYVEAGATMLFIEALENWDDFSKFRKAFQHVPLLVNMTEFGKTEIKSYKECVELGVDMILYPLTAMRMMHKAASKTFTTILKAGSQQSLLDEMQTRDELYQMLNYHAFEELAD